MVHQILYAFPGSLVVLIFNSQMSPITQGHVVGNKMHNELSKMYYGHNGETYMVILHR